MSALRFYDAFHGVGGSRYGLEQAGMKCVGGCEIDRFACRAYGVINDEDCQPTDIRTVDPFRLPEFDCFVFGWPCQDNSVAGKRRGQIERNDTNEGNRSGLLFEAVRIMRIKRPRYFIAENVTGLFSVNDGIDFYTTIQLFTDLGYDCQWQVLNTRWFLPQNRERLFFVGHLRETPRPKILPIGADDELGETSRIEKRQKVQVIPCLEATGYKGVSSERFYGVLQDRPIEPVIIQKSRGFNQGGVHEIAPTLTKNSYEQNNVVFDGVNIRKLTPLEYFRFQGYPDWWFHKCKKAGISDSQLYKMAGNGISSSVAKEIGTRLMG